MTSYKLTFTPDTDETDALAAAQEAFGDVDISCHYYQRGVMILTAFECWQEPVVLEPIQGVERL